MNFSEKQAKLNSDNKKRQKLIKDLNNYDDDEINFDLDDVSQLDEMEEKKIENSSRKSFNTNSNTDEKNKKSIVVRNLDTETSIDEVEKLFSKFGLVNKVTMLYDKYTGKPKGTAYVDFEKEDSKETSKGMNQKFYKSKVIRVEDKTKEIPTHLGRKEKCFNVNMRQYFSSTKNNFGPIRIKKTLRKVYEPY